MSEENTAIKKKSKKVLIVALAMLAATIVIVIAVLAVYSSNPERRLKKQFELGERYLSELNYEQAVAAYRVAIEIDPKSVDAYLGLAVAYVGMDEYEEAVKSLTEGYEITKDAIILESVADTYIKWTESVLAGGNEDKTVIDRAIEILKEGYEYTGDERLAERIAALEKQEEEMALIDSSDLQEASSATQSISNYNIDKLEEINITEYYFELDGDTEWIRLKYTASQALDIRIAVVGIGEWTKERIAEAKENFDKSWKDDEVYTDEGSVGVGFPSSWMNSDNQTVLLFGRNENGEIVGYAVIPLN